MTDAHDDDNPNPMLPDVPDVPDEAEAPIDFSADLVKPRDVEIDVEPTRRMLRAIRTGREATAALGKHVKAVREALLLSRASVEFDTGVSESRLNAIENGAFPDLLEAERLALWLLDRALGAPKPTIAAPRLRPPRQRKAKG